MGPLEIVLILVVIALVFGGKKLGELGKGMGQGIREFKKEVNADGLPGAEAAPLAQVVVPEAVDVPSQVLDPAASSQNPTPQNPAERR